ncbi:MAG: hypothetical protein ACLUEK_02675 [Oscillospiraceae bacterium]
MKSDINVYYGAIHALKGVSLTVADGELVCSSAPTARADHHAAHDLRPAARGDGLSDARRRGPAEGRAQQDYQPVSHTSPRAGTSLPA